MCFYAISFFVVVVLRDFFLFFFVFDGHTIVLLSQNALVVQFSNFLLQAI